MCYVAQIAFILPAAWRWTWSRARPSRWRRPGRWRSTFPWWRPAWGGRVPCSWKVEDRDSGGGCQGIVIIVVIISSKWFILCPVIPDQCWPLQIDQIWWIKRSLQPDSEVKLHFPGHNWLLNCFLTEFNKQRTVSPMLDVLFNIFSFLHIWQSKVYCVFNNKKSDIWSSHYRVRPTHLRPTLTPPIWVKRPLSLVKVPVLQGHPQRLQPSDVTSEFEYSAKREDHCRTYSRTNPTNI